MARKLEIMKGAWLATAYTLEDSVKFIFMGIFFGLGFHMARWVINILMIKAMGGPVG